MGRTEVLILLVVEEVVYPCRRVMTISSAAWGSWTNMIPLRLCPCITLT